MVCDKLHITFHHVQLPHALGQFNAMRNQALISILPSMPDVDD